MEQNKSIPNDFSGTIADAVMRISEGSSVAASYLYYLLSFQEMDKLSYIRMLRVLDRFRLTGDRLENFFSEVCFNKVDNFFCFCYLCSNIEKYPEFKRKIDSYFNEGGNFNFEILFIEVKEREPYYFLDNQEIRGDEFFAQNEVNQLLTKFSSKKAS